MKNKTILLIEQLEKLSGKKVILKEEVIEDRRRGNFLDNLQNETGIIFNQVSVTSNTPTEVCLLLGDYEDMTYSDEITNLESDLGDKPGYEFHTAMGDDIPHALTINTEADLSLLTGYTLAQLEELTDSCTDSD